MIDYTNSNIAYYIDEYIHDEVHRRIMKRRLIDGVCFEPLAEEFGYSVRQIKRIVYREQVHLFDKMQKR